MGRMNDAAEQRMDREAEGEESTVEAAEDALLPFCQPADFDPHQEKLFQATPALNATKKAQ